MCKYCEKVRAEREGELNAQDKLDVENCSKLNGKRLPCSVLTGFLGSGKTTLLNRLLKGNPGKRFVVIENEVGEQSVDDELLRKSDVNALPQETEVVLMPNGCLCCRVRGDLVNALKRTIAKADTVDGIIIELSGLSELAPVVQTFFADPFVQRSIRLDGIFCVVDILHAHDLLEDEYVTEDPKKLGSLLREQISLADMVLVNKIDKLTEGQKVEQVLDCISQVNESCELHLCSLQNEEKDLPGDLGTTRFMNLNSFSSRSAAIKAVLLQLNETADGGSSETRKEVHGHGHRHGNHHHGTLGFSTLSISFSEFPLVLDQLRSWLEESVIKSYPDALVRYKGIIWTRQFGFDERYILQGVYGHLELIRDRMIFQQNEKKSILVFIGPLKEERFGKLEERLCKGVVACAMEPDVPEPQSNEDGKKLQGLANVRAAMFTSYDLTM